ADGLGQDAVAQALVLLRVGIDSDEQGLDLIGRKFLEVERARLALVRHFLRDNRGAEEIRKVDQTHGVVPAVMEVQPTPRPRHGKGTRCEAKCRLQGECRYAFQWKVLAPVRWTDRADVTLALTAISNGSS